MIYKRTIAYVLALCVITISFSYLSSFYKADINAISDTVLYTKMVDITGIGPTLAQRVVVYRNTNRPINVNDLNNVPGIGDKKLEAIKHRFKE